MNQTFGASVPPWQIRFRVFVFSWLVLVSTIALHAAFPAPTGRVTDAAGVMSEDARQEVLQRINGVESATGAEIAVVTVPSLDGMSVEEYGNRLFNEWGVGKKGSDNGVLILVAPSDRKIRIEVGYGLEPILPDGLAGDVIRNQAVPAFKDGDFEKGILDSVQRIAGIIVAKQVVTPEERARLKASAENLAPTLLTTLFFGVFTSIGAVMLAVGLRAKVRFFVLFGSAFGGLPGLFGLFPPLNVSWRFLGPWLVILFTWALYKGGTERWRKIAREGSKGAKGTGWVSGGSSSSGSSSSSSSSSSSFGGGSSGGGGASGSW